MNEVTEGSVWESAIGVVVVAIRSRTCISEHCKETMGRTTLCGGKIWYCLNTSTFHNSWCCVECEVFYHKPKELPKDGLP